MFSHSFDELVAVVTGASSGIGLAAARAFLTAGAHVIVTGRNANALARVTADSAGLVAVSGDVADPAHAARVAETARERWGRLDILVNNAGLLARAGLEDASPATMERLFATNVVGPTLMTQAALPALKATRGAVVNVSSTAGIKPAPPVAQYGATKAALDHLTRCWALELAPSGVRVNAVAPGPTESGMLDRVGFPAHVQEMIRQDEARRVPLGRRGTADEVASWIVALAHPSASWVTGQVIAIDGGLTLT